MNARDKMPFEVTPIYYKLQRYEDAQKAPNAPTPGATPAPSPTSGEATPPPAPAPGDN
jgi:hypothetical protein